MFSYNALASFPGGYGQVLLPIYMKQIGISALLVGVLTTISLLATSILLIPFGILSDRYGRRMFLILGGVLTAASWAIMAFSTDIAYIGISRALVGTGAALSPHRSTLCWQIFPLIRIEQGCSAFRRLLRKSPQLGEH